MTDDTEIIYSPLAQTYSADGHSVRIQIYRTPDAHWVLEVVDEHGTSTVWDDLFETDKAALEEALWTLETEGISSFIAESKAAEPELLKALAQTVQSTAQGVPDMMASLSDKELEELDQFLLYGLDNDEAMTLDTLDGYLHAIAIGPQTVMPSQWLPKVWGEDSATMPPMDSIEQLNHIMGLFMRHSNSIIHDFQHKPPLVAPSYQVACDAALVDLRPLSTTHLGLMLKTDDSTAQWVGARLHREGHTGLGTASVRHAAGQNYVVLNPDVLSNPQHHGQLTYRLGGPRIVVERQSGVAWMAIYTAAL